MRHSFYLNFAESLDRRANARIHELTAELLKSPPRGLLDLVPGYRNLLVEFDSSLTSKPKLQKRLEAALEAVSLILDSRHLEIPLRYDGEDLAAVASTTGLTIQQVIGLHQQQDYWVYALGFTPGFPFMGELDPRLAVPRRQIPRRHVPAHSVAIAGVQTGIYPLSSPGGWHLIGTALQAVYDPLRAEPFLLRAGDTVRFVASEGKTPPEPRALELLPSEPRFPCLQVEEEGLLDLVMDTGRMLGGRYGLAQSGPLDPLCASLANRLLGNPPAAPVVELTLKGPVLTALEPLVLAFAGYGMVPVVSGEEVRPFSSFLIRPQETLRFRATAHGVRGYLAVAGGFESSGFMGSCASDLRGKIGRSLRRGDILGRLSRKEVRAGFATDPPALSNRVRILPGPQASKEALEALTLAEFTLESGDRMGLRLSGADVPGGELLSEGAPLGAVQLPPGGKPIILLNDRGRLGGYHKPAVVDPRDIWRLAQVRAGQTIQFYLSEY